MPMKMGWRWYGEGNDPISLSDIKQIPGVTSIVWALHDKMPGEIWEIDEIQKVADQIHAYGFDMDVVESVNVHEKPTSLTAKITTLPNWACPLKPQGTSTQGVSIQRWSTCCWKTPALQSLLTAYRSILMILLRLVSQHRMPCSRY